MRLILFALLLAFMVPVPARAETDKNYLDFAAKSNEGPSNGSTCRSYGGQPLLGQHQKVVMHMGRRDPKLSNVIYHGGHHYVTFSVETSSFWGSKDTVVALCHFAG